MFTEKGHTTVASSMRTVTEEFGNMEAMAKDVVDVVHEGKRTFLTAHLYLLGYCPLGTFVY